jgi:hypothetical protein
MARRFPPPWSVEELDACFVLRDANGETVLRGSGRQVAQQRRGAKDRSEYRQAAGAVAEHAEKKAVRVLD